MRFLRFRLDCNIIGPGLQHHPSECCDCRSVCCDCYSGTMIPGVTVGCCLGSAWFGCVCCWSSKGSGPVVDAAGGWRLRDETVPAGQPRFTELIEEARASPHANAGSLRWWSGCETQDMQFLDPRGVPSRPIEPYANTALLADGESVALFANGFPDSVAFLQHLELSLLPFGPCRRRGRSRSCCCLIL